MVIFEAGEKIANKIWRQITPKYLEKLYETSPIRMEAVIAVGGSRTKYWWSFFIIMLPSDQ